MGVLCHPRYNSDDLMKARPAARGEEAGQGSDAVMRLYQGFLFPKGLRLLCLFVCLILQEAERPEVSYLISSHINHFRTNGSH